MRHVPRRSVHWLYASLLVLGLTMVPGDEAAAACRGTWAEGVQYAAGDTVNYNGVVYTARVAHGCNGCGWNPVAAGSLWSQGGTCSGTGTPTPRPGNTPRPRPGNTPRPNPGTGCFAAWVPGATYVGGNQVSRNGQNYRAVYWTQADPAFNNGPVNSGAPWNPLGGCTGGGNTPTPTPRPGNPTPTPRPNPGNGLGAILSQAQFNQMFPNRNPFYTYQGLLTAAARYPSFAGSGDTAARRREAAAAMANFGHETGGLVHITEIAQGEYCSGTATPCGVCAAGKRYFGRGPIQLSWNFNYCSAGRALGLNLWADPDLVARDPAVAWSTALWYWMTQNGPGSQPAHNCMTSNAGFGCTIRAINGSLECNGGNPAQVQSRINSYSNFKGILGAGGSVGPDGC
jgi:predicted chitinase